MEQGQWNDTETDLLKSGPCSLEKLCNRKILDNILLFCGRKIEDRARLILEASNGGSSSATSGFRGRSSSNSLSGEIENQMKFEAIKPRRRKSSTTILTVDALDEPESVDYYTQTSFYQEQTSKCREYLSTHLSSCTLDNLVSEVQQLSHRSGFFFALSSLCSDRLSHLPISPPNSAGYGNSNGNDSGTGSTDKSIELMGSAISSHLLLECIGHLANLARLTLHALATNIMLYSIAETCTKLQVLDISFSSEVTDLGLLYLSGGSGRCERYLPKPPQGCKYLRELHFNPQSSSTTINPVMPRVVAYILRQMKYIRVCDMERLSDGLQYYLHGPEGGYHPKMNRISNLKLTHFQDTASQELTEEMLQICPYLRNIKLNVVDNLEKVGQALQSNPQITLDKVTLAYGEDQPSVHPSLTTFLQLCGQRINTLRLECSNKTFLTNKDLTTIATNCPLLDALEIVNLSMSEDPDIISASAVPKPLNFRFLTQLKLYQISVAPPSAQLRELCLFMLAGCPDLEVLHLEFPEKAWFFSDFLLDEILVVNPLPRLETFVIKNAAMTLISALRLLNQRPKLKKIGQILQWDVEISELDTFEQIIKRAKSLNLLHDVTFL